MSITLFMTVRTSCHGYSSRLGLCLGQLGEACSNDRACLLLRIYSQDSDPMIWLVEGLWRSAESRDAFLNSEPLHRVLAEVINKDLIASLRFTALPQLRVVKD